MFVTDTFYMSLLGQRTRGLFFCHIPHMKLTDEMTNKFRLENGLLHIALQDDAIGNPFLTKLLKA